MTYRIIRHIRDQRNEPSCYTLSVSPIYRDIDTLAFLSSCGIPHDFHGSFNNDHARPRRFAYTNANRRLSCHLERTNSSLESLTSLPALGSLSLALFGPAALLVLLRSHRLFILSSLPCPSFTLAYPYPSLLSVSLATNSSTLSVSQDLHHRYSILSHEISQSQIHRDNSKISNV